MPSKPPIVFVDTNILLDAYRTRNDVGLHLIQRLDDVHEHLVTTYQVEMEFKKNRQAAILESLVSLKPPEASIAAPAFLSQAKTVEIMKRNTEDTKKRMKGLKDKLENILANPTSHDPVYQVAQRLFSSSSDLRLCRSDKRKHSVRRRAWRRFVLGYPPRKKSDTSTGDGINWEWIVDCVESSNRDVIIVSRDGDFGCSVGGDAFINDWLVQELKDRTKSTRKITLTPKLSVALNKLKVKVTKEEKKEEDDSLKYTSKMPQMKIPQLNISDEMLKQVQERMRRLSQMFDDESGQDDPPDKD